MKTLILKAFVIICLLAVMPGVAGRATASTNNLVGISETNVIQLSERSARILLEVVSVDEDSSLALLCAVLSKSKHRALTKEVVFEMMPLLNTGTNVCQINISAIIKKYGEPTSRKRIQTKPKDPKDAPTELDLYNFDDSVFLTCRTSSTCVEGLVEPDAWFILGIRKKAQEALAGKLNQTPPKASTEKGVNP